jgi:DNA-binding beta-propeller fold protein YncE
VLLLGAAGTSPAADPPPLELVQTIGLKGPDGKLDHFALDTKRDRLLVANQVNNSLDVVDLKAGKLLTQVVGQKSISGIAYVADLDRVFVGNSAGGVCNAFDGGRYDLLKSLPFPSADNVRFDARSGLVVLGHKALAIIDPKTMTVKTDIALPGSPRAFRSEPDRPRLYANTSSGVVSVVDTDRLEVVARYPIKLAGGNYALALDPANRRVFVGCRKEPKLVVVDSDTGREITSLDIPGDVDDIAYDAKRRRIYASCGEGYLIVVQQTDADHYAPLATMATAKLARTSLFDPDSGRLFLGVPRQEGKAGPEIRVYQARP